MMTEQNKFLTNYSLAKNDVPYVVYALFKELDYWNLGFLELV